jgi:hypothetical protein
MATTNATALDYSETMKIIKDVAIGSIISEEDYKKLGAGYEDYF